jgi:hypothetical protein
LFLIVALDDVLLWFSSPMLAIPITLVLIILGLVFMLGGKTLFNQIISRATESGKALLQTATTQAASKLLKKE